MKELFKNSISCLSPVKLVNHNSIFQLLKMILLF
jgi:hypothetical protein